MWCGKPCYKLVLTTSKPSSAFCIFRTTTTILHFTTPYPPHMSHCFYIPEFGNHVTSLEQGFLEGGRDWTRGTVTSNFCNMRNLIPILFGAGKTEIPGGKNWIRRELTANGIHICASSARILFSCNSLIMRFYDYLQIGFLYWMGIVLTWIMLISGH